MANLIRLGFIAIGARERGSGKKQIIRADHRQWRSDHEPITGTRHVACRPSRQASAGRSEGFCVDKISHGRWRNALEWKAVSNKLYPSTLLIKCADLDLYEMLAAAERDIIAVPGLRSSSATGERERLLCGPQHCNQNPAPHMPPIPAARLCGAPGSIMPGASVSIMPEGIGQPRFGASP